VTWLQTLASLLQASELSQALRASLWLYPLVNTAHIVGIALLFGAIAPLDLRLLGCWKGVPIDPLARVLVPTAVTGLVLALATGSLLFATRPLDYVGEPLFALKLGLVVSASANAALLRRRMSRHTPPSSTEESPPLAWMAAGVLSIALWLGAITVGRLIGFR
jgi:hypothetical protein